ncbi:alpha/beta hydrolase [Stutzerimonas chloritidismutans]|uniref:Alpha/beta hydrolase n=1 Tax=Stutzerimonas chloritidismutans TaxID=203192 RepID=A0ABU9MB81_STUCH
MLIAHSLGCPTVALWAAHANAEALRRVWRIGEA